MRALAVEQLQQLSAWIIGDDLSDASVDTRASPTKRSVECVSGGQQLLR
jgi:hypothetical protein